MTMHKFVLAALLASPAALLAQPSPPSPPPFARPPMRGHVFLSPMGEPFRAEDPAADNVATWFNGADTDRDGALTLSEIEADAARFFATLDTSRDGELGPEEVSRYEMEIAPEVQLGRQMGAGMGARGGFGGFGGERRGGGGWGGHRRGGGGGGEGRGGGEGGWHRGGGEFDAGLEGAGRFSFLNIPEPVISADADLNRGVSRAEFVKAAGQRFLMLDTNKDGRLTRAELPPLPERHAGKGKNKKMPPRPREGTPLPDG